jgi:hypothetical protein
MSLSLVAVAAAVALGFGGSSSQVEPGGKIGAMKLVVGTHYQAHEWFVDLCKAAMPTPGRYRGSCKTDRAARIFIGSGDFESTKPALARLWKHSTWKAWLDGRRIDLRAFGATDRVWITPRRQAVFLREWNVTLIGATPGKHTLRYIDRVSIRTQYEAPGTYDGTWTLTVVP